MIKLLEERSKLLDVKLEVFTDLAGDIRIVVNDGVILREMVEVGDIPVFYWLISRL